MNRLVDPNDLVVLRRELWGRELPAQLRGASLVDFEPDVAEPLEGWLAEIVAGQCRNLIISGPVGVGKSHLVAAVTGRLFELRVRALWRTTAELLDALKPGGDPAEGNRIRSTPVLVLDDLGAHRSTDWANERLYQLINRRWEDRHSIIATTNLAAVDLADALGERAWSRLRGGALVVPMTGPDRRRLTNQKGQP